MIACPFFCCIHFNRFPSLDFCCKKFRQAVKLGSWFQDLHTLLCASHLVLNIAGCLLFRCPRSYSRPVPVPAPTGRDRSRPSCLWGSPSAPRRRCHVQPQLCTGNSASGQYIRWTMVANHWFDCLCWDQLVTPTTRGIQKLSGENGSKC